MPSAYSVPMASDVLPDPDTPTTATVRQSGTSTSMSCRLLCRAPCTPMTLGSVSGTGIAAGSIPGNLSQCGGAVAVRAQTGPAGGIGGALAFRRSVFGFSVVDTWHDRRTSA